MVATGLLHTQAARNQLKRLGIPVVETWDLSDHPVDMLVGFSHRKVGSAVAGFFLAKGRTQVGIASGDDQRATVRREGFLSAMGRAVPTALVPAPSTMAGGRQALANLLAQDRNLRAVYCSSDQLAQGVLAEAQSRGIRVPQDLAVCGVGGADFAAHMAPSLTTVQVDGAAIGRLAAAMVMDRCSGRVVAQPVVDVGFQIIERQSTCGPAG